MAKVVLLFSIFFTLAVPAALSAEELLPAICQQILIPEKNTSISEIIKNHFIERTREIPGEIKEVASGAANAIGETLGASKDTAISRLESQVLGTSTKKTDSSGILDFFLRHWLWTVSGLGTLTIIWFLRR